MTIAELYVKLRIDWDPSERLENNFYLYIKSWSCTNKFIPKEEKLLEISNGHL